MKECEADTGDSITTNLQRRQDHNGRTGLLKYHTERLLRYFFELREQDFGVLVRMVIRQASLIS